MYICILYILSIVSCIYNLQEFLVNGGKVTAFTQPDTSVIQLRKPQVSPSISYTTEEEAKVVAVV